MASIKPLRPRDLVGQQCIGQQLSQQGFGIFRGLVQSFRKVSCGRHQASLREVEVGGTIVDGAGFVNSAQRIKALEKAGTIRDIVVDTAFSIVLNRSVEFAHCPKFTAGFARFAVAAVSAGAILSRRPSGLDADGLAVADGCAGVAAMGRFRRDLAGVAAQRGAAEDAKFCSHHGVDWGALRDVIDDAEDGEDRGGSTITQQVAKNLFLWPAAAWSARRWSCLWRCGSIWCCRNSGF